MPGAVNTAPGLIDGGRTGGGTGSQTLPKTEINIIQVNLNKAHSAQIELLNTINKQTSYIAQITEPYCYKGKLSLLPTNSTIIPTQRTGNPRAALYASKHLTLNEITELTHRDMVVGLTRLDGKQTAIISLYLDITARQLQTSSLKP